MDTIDIFALIFAGLCIATSIGKALKEEHKEGWAYAAMGWITALAWMWIAMRRK